MYTQTQINPVLTLTPEVSANRSSLVRRWRHRLAVVMAALTLVVGLSVTGAASANAAERDCSAWRATCTWRLDAQESEDFKIMVATSAAPAVFVPGVGPVLAAGLAVDAGALEIALNHGYCVEITARGAEVLLSLATQKHIKGVEVGLWDCTPEPSYAGYN